MREEGIALEKALLCIDEQQRTYIEQLKAFVRIPSVSAGADVATGDGLAQAADFLVGQFNQMGFEVEKIQVRAATNPLVLARSPRVLAGPTHRLGLWPLRCTRGGQPALGLGGGSLCRRRTGRLHHRPGSQRQ